MDIREAPPPRQDPIFNIGPDRGESVRESRPYFLIPMDDDDPLELARTRVLEWLSGAADPEKPAGPKRVEALTDIYVVSHGWHRNFFAAVSVYDRLMSRMTLLLHRERITPPPGWYPLFLTLHWHSDPGEDNFVDSVGRRHKVSFLRNAEAVFEPIAPAPKAAATDPAATTAQEARRRCFTNDFEDLYEFLTLICAPGANPLTSTETIEKAGHVDTILEHYQLMDGAEAEENHPAAEKIVVLWKCYHESTPRSLLLNQSPGETPAAFLSAKRKLSGLWRYVGGTIGIGTIVLASLKWIGPNLWKLIHKHLTSWKLLNNLPNYVTMPIKFAALWGLFYLIALIYYRIELRRGGAPIQHEERQAQATGTRALNDELAPRDERRHGPPLFPLFFWLILELPLLLVAVGWLFLTYVFNVNRRNLFPERVLEQEKAPSPDSVTSAQPRQPTRLRHGGRERFLAVVRRPITWLTLLLNEDSALRTPASLLDRQLAFFEMQRRGVETGEDAAVFLNGLLEKMQGLSPKANPNGFRLHLLGHSFGGLVVMNAARRLTNTFNRKLRSVCLVQAAMGSAWMLGEERLLQSVEGAIGCLYSRYDSANGSLYPAANQARIAAGFVGLYGGKDPALFRAENFGKDGSFASLVVPPDLSRCAAGAASTGARVLNLDASRLIYEGSIAAGGGHDDIFKDDVVNLIWAVTVAEGTQSAGKSLG